MRPISLAGMTGSGNDRKAYAHAVSQVEREVTRRVQRSNSIEAQSPQEIVVRDIVPSYDLAPGDDNDWDGESDEWVQSGLRGGEWNYVYVLDSRDRARQKVICFFAIGSVDGGSDARVRFSNGLSGHMGPERAWNFSGKMMDDEIVWLFDNPVFNDPGCHGVIEVKPPADTTENLRLHAVVGERVGETVTEATNPMVSQK